MVKYKNNTRAFVSVCQAVIDSLVYRFSFWLAVSLWLDGKIPVGFTSEVIYFFTGTMLAVFYFNSLYSFKTWLLWDEIKAVLKSSLLILLVAVLYLYSQGFDISRFTLAAGIIIFIPLCIISRWIVRRLLFSLGILSTNIIILGAGRTGTIFADKIAGHPFTLGRVTGFLDDDEAKQGITVAGVKVRGKLEDFTALCASERVDEAAVAISSASRSFLTHILDLVEFHVRQVHYIPDMYMLTAFSSSIRDVDGMPVISASQGLLNPVSRTVKSLADYTAAFVTLILWFPLMICVAAAVKMSDGGEVFSRQERSGQDGRKFLMYKFRLSGFPHSGAKLRRAYLDELPQILNVLRGEMSLVGPKAFTGADMLHVYGGETARKISMVKPGITGFWQISDREKDKRICGEMNLYYIRNWSLWLDIVILLRTFIEIFRARTR
ncbi:MAG: sugar transferase [Synergistaceae bacterium]|nr:sugar transferase [Synergistaceae bacterium]MBQ6972805.1 sugar transferase [Synergistaceae bacterium]